MAVLIGYSLYKGYKRQAKAWQTYTLKIDQEKISRSIKGFPDMIIEKSQVKEIVELPNADIMIKTVDKGIFIAIPGAISDRNRLKQLLADFGIIRKEAQKGNQLRLITFALFTMLIMSIFFVSKTPWVVITTGLPLIILLTWSYFKLRNSKLIELKVRQKLPLIIFPMLFIIAKLLVTLLG